MINSVEFEVEFKAIYDGHLGSNCKTENTLQRAVEIQEKNVCC